MSDKKPAARVRLYPITATIWRNQQSTGPFYSVQFQKSYKDNEGHWQHSDAFASTDLLLLAKLADLAETEIRQLRSKDRSDAQSEETA